LLLQFQILIYVHKNHSSHLTASNFAAIVGFFRVNLLTETSCALSLASGRFLSLLSNLPIFPRAA
jgi:hypothetical protein